MLNRRDLIKTGLGVGAGLALGRWGKWGSAYAFNQSPGIPLFGTTLRGVGPGGIPVAAPDAFPAPVTGVTHYSIDINQFTDSGVCPTLGPTTLWGYNPVNPLGGGSQPQKHLAGIIVGQKGVPIQLSVRNNLFVNEHILPVDMTIPGAQLGVNRTAVHLHGGLVPWISDGGPFDWYGPSGTHGLSFLNNQVLNPSAPLGSAEYYYPLNQSARFLWYHDHAVGITRLNAYAGIATGLIVRDGFEINLKNQGLPEFIENSVLGGMTVQELPIVIQEKIFVDNKIHKSDPTWPGPTSEGSLWYAHVYDPARWDVGAGGLPIPDPSCIPEFFGDTMLVNGTVYPETTVQARRYRLRLLNATNARFLNLQLYEDDGSRNGITLNTAGKPTNKPFVNAATGDPSFLQIGTEGGFLSKPVKVPSNQPFGYTPGYPGPDEETGQTDPSKILKSLLVAPAERPDVIVDFSGYTGKSVILYGDAPAPFPSGEEVNDYFPGFNVTENPVNGRTKNGFGPNSRVLMRFKVVPAQGVPDLTLTIDSETDLTPGIDPFLTPWGVTTPPPGKPRFLSLNECFDEYGRLIQILGNGLAPYGSPYEGHARYMNYPPKGKTKTVGSTEESVRNGDTEVWEIYNTTGDVHPMHFHLVNVQLINRQLFDLNAFPAFVPAGPVLSPEPNELGWKETVPMYPGTVTRVIMKFDVPKILRADGTTVVPTPSSPRTGGNEYVWHCHILEHEEHDMMHALVVT